MSQALSLGAPVPSALATCEVLDEAAQTHTLASLWEGSTTLLFFIRHFGCIGCSENMGLVAPRLPEILELGAQVVIIGSGEPQYIEDFRKRFALSYQHLQIVTDPSLQVFRAAGLVRSWWATQGFRGMRDAVRAFSRGYTQTKSRGDSWQQGGALVVDQQGHIQYLHRNRSLGDHAPVTAWMAALLRIYAAQHPSAT